MRLEIVDTPPKDQRAHYRSVRSRLTGFRRGAAPKPVETAVPISWTYGGMTAQGNVISFDFRSVTISEIIAAVCGFYKISGNDLVSACRQARIVYPRQVAMYLCRELTPKSFPLIGRMFGGRDHTTALHAWRKISELVKTDERMCDEIDVLIRKIKS
jgi:hypothetical protein